MNYLLVGLVCILLYLKGEEFIFFFKESDLDELSLLMDYDLVKLFRLRLVFLYIFLPLIILSSSYLRLFLLVCLCLFYKRDYLKLKKRKKRLQQQLSYEFPIWMRSVQTHLQSNTVVGSLRLSLDEAPEILYYPLESLLLALDYRPNDLSIYESFMSDYENLELNKMMKSMFRFSQMGRLDSQIHLDRMIEHTADLMNEMRVSKQKNLLEGFSFLGILPVILVSFYFVLMMFLVMVSMIEGGWMV